MDYQLRQQNLQHTIRTKGWSGFLVTQNVDLYYYSGSMQNGYLFIPAEGDPTFYVKRSVARAEQEAQVSVVSLGSFRTFGERLLQDYPQCFGQHESLLATEFDVLPVQLYFRLQHILPFVQWVDGSQVVREQRMIKSIYEIERIRHAAVVVDRCLLKSLDQLKPGIRDVDFMRIIENELRSEGHAGLMRMRGFNQELITGMVASGSAAAVPTYFDGPAGGEGLSPASPQSSGRKIIARDEPILIDIGCCIDGYIIDQTRMAVIGKLSEELIRAYLLATEIEGETEKELKPGTICEHLYLKSLERVAMSGLANHYMGYGEDQVRFLGHGIGLEIDELPVLARGFGLALQPGMVIAVEPKFTFPNIGVVGIEDTYVITELGYEQLTVTDKMIFER